MRNKMKKQKFYLLFLLCILSFSISCQKENEVTPVVEQKNIEIENQEGLMELGKKLENPYSVETMTQALKNISSRINTDDLIIEKTHYYVKFSPQNEDELNLLKQDTTLVLYNYPLDVEIIKEGDYYHDPSLPQDQPTYQYASVEVNHDLPKSVKYEILSELYIPDAIPTDSNNNARLTSNDYVDILINEALKITNNAVDDNQNSRIETDEWQPMGRVRVWDNKVHTWTNVEGVEVRARRWFTTHKGVTDGNGIFFCDGKFKGSARYSIDWETYHFSIRSGAVGQAGMKSSTTKDIWWNDIGEGSIHQYYATIFQAAHFYYYKDILGLKRPPLNGFWKSQMKIGLFDSEGRASHNDDRRYAGIRNQIKMYRTYKDGSFRNTERNYITTLHELAHASHWELRKGDWDFNTEDKLQESWAVGVSWALGRLRYPNYNSISKVSFQWIIDEGEREYTPVIIDLIDDFNQNKIFSNAPIDRVTGYSISEIESVLGTSKNLEQLRNNLQNKYDKPTDAFLNELFQQYIIL